MEFWIALIIAFYIVLWIATRPMWSAPWVYRDSMPLVSNPEHERDRHKETKEHIKAYADIWMIRPDQEVSRSQKKRFRKMLKIKP